MGSLADHLSNLPGSGSINDKLIAFFGSGRPTHVTAGVPTDNDFIETPADGTTALDNASGHLFVRWGGVWTDITGAGGGAGGAPVGATYLVGAAHAELTTEIVVGATPGGELGGTWADPTIDGTHSGSTHQAATDTHIAAIDPHQAIIPITFSRSDILVVGVGKIRWYNRLGRTLTIFAVDAAVDTQPTGASVIVDININGTSVWNATQANRPTIAVSTNQDLGGALDDATLANGEYLMMDVDQIGSTIPGADLSVTVWMRG